MMLFRSILVAMGLALGAAAGVHANPISITNATSQELNFKLRCKSPGQHEWQVFRSAVGDSTRFNQKGCQEYSFEMTTTRSGMEVKVKYVFAGGTRHKLIYDANKHAFDSRKLKGAAD